VRSKVFAATLGLMLAAVTARPELDIQVKGFRVDIRAQRVSLQQVLDELSQKTGMKVVYDTEPPQEIVSFDLVGLNLGSAVMQVLNGHGLTYALSMDRTGLRVDTLLLTHGGAGALKAQPPPPPMPEQQQEEIYEEPEPNEPPPPGEPTPTPPPTPAAYWTPGPVLLPGQGLPGMPGSAPPASEPAHIEQVPPSMEGQPPPQ
jgi:hypothetical protein